MQYTKKKGSCTPWLVRGDFVEEVMLPDFQKRNRNWPNASKTESGDIAKEAAESKAKRNEKRGLIWGIIK